MQRPRIGFSRTLSIVDREESCTTYDTNSTTLTLYSEYKTLYFQRKNDVGTLTTGEQMDRRQQIQRRRAQIKFTTFDVNCMKRHRLSTCKTNE
jgi:hypothetical protein